MLDRVLARTSLADRLFRAFEAPHHLAPTAQFQSPPPLSIHCHPCTALQNVQKELEIKVAFRDHANIQTVHRMILLPGTIPT